MKVALAYSGGLDTTVSIKWLQERYDAEVITVTVDVGQEEDFEKIEEKAMKSGAIKHFFIDAKKKFAEEYVAKCIKANGLYEGVYPLSSALSRPLIAEEVAEIALREGCDAVAHGCTGKGNDQIRFDVTFSVKAPDLKIIAPVREWNMSRDQEVKYALKHGLPVNPEKSRFSIDENLWGRSIEAGELEDPWAEPPIEAFKYLKRLEEAPNHPQEIVIEFDSGVPLSIDGVRMPLEQLIAELNKIGGIHGFGYLDHIEDRVVGLKSREVYEAPAALLLISAHMDLEKMVLNKRILDFKSVIEHEWAEMVYSGLWVDPLMNALNAFIEETQKEVTGEVRIKLYKGSARIVGRRAEKPLYDPEMITYTSKSVFDQRAGEAFSKLWGLSSTMHYIHQKEAAKRS